MSSIALPGLSWRDRAHRVKQLIIETFVVGATMLSEMPFLDHLEELRSRLIKALIALAVGTMIGLAYTAPIMAFLEGAAATAGIRLVAIEATEIFSLYFKVALAAGICLAAPVILWQVWRFIEPALHKHEKRYAAPFIISTTLCFIAGGVFGYGVVAPWLLRLEVEMAIPAHIEIAMSAESYFAMLTATVISMGAIFEMPPAIFILSRIGLVSATFLMRTWMLTYCFPLTE